MWTVLLFQPGCVFEEGEPGGDPGPGPEAPEGAVDAPGTCFEVFGPPGISHSAPRRHDLGVVTVGESRPVDVRFYNFCADATARLHSLDWLEGPGDFAVSSPVAPGEPFATTASMEGTTLTITFTPASAGMQRAGLRVWISHGYYDLEVAAEGVLPGDGPAPIDLACLETERTVEVPSVDSGGPTPTVAVDLPLLCAYEFGREHLVVEMLELAGATDAWSFTTTGMAWNVAVPNAGNYPSDPVALPPVRMTFDPPGPGVYEAKLTLRTNDRSGSSEVVVRGTAR
jgi:hypothetical protein